MRDKRRLGRCARVRDMRVLRRHRGWLSGWLIAQLLFMQLATAAYACPKLAAERLASMAATAMALMPGCDGDMAAMDPGQPQLCKAHCDAAGQTVNSSLGAANVPLPALIGALWVRVLDVAVIEQLAAAMPEAQPVGPPAGTPPLYLALLVLRN